VICRPSLFITRYFLNPFEISGQGGNFILSRPRVLLQGLLWHRLVPGTDLSKKTWKSVSPAPVGSRKAAHRAYGPPRSLKIEAVSKDPANPFRRCRLAPGRAYGGPVARRMPKNLLCAAVWLCQTAAQRRFLGVRGSAPRTFHEQKRSPGVKTASRQKGLTRALLDHRWSRVPFTFQIRHAA
jgi:hypothetical protein